MNCLKKSNIFSVLEGIDNYLKIRYYNVNMYVYVLTLGNCVRFVLHKFG